MANSGAEMRQPTADGKTVAIACQGGGSHTAFTAGVLQELLEQPLPGYRLQGFSGTSGGALCAATAWYGLLSDGPEGAVALLESLWGDVAATTPTEAAINAWGRWYMSLQDRGFPVPEISPHHNPLAMLGQSELREIVERHLDFEMIPRLVDETSPQLQVGAVNVTEGTFVVFPGEELVAEHLLATTAVPTLFPSVTIDGEEYWDGLYSQNPPIRNFLAGVPAAAAKPDEIWIVQVSPRTREEPPTSLRGILDRRTELSGNRSLRHEVRFVERVNEWIDTGRLTDDRYKHVDVRWIRPEIDLPVRSERNTAPEFVRALMADGRQQARSFVGEALQAPLATP